MEAPCGSRRKNHRRGDLLHPEDFVDVFGGPPRSVLRRSFSCSAYHPVPLCNKNSGLPPAGWNRVPVRERVKMPEGFYDDILSLKCIDKSRFRSMFSSEKTSATAAAPAAEDCLLTSIASKLRPIKVPSRRRCSCSSLSTLSMGEHYNQVKLGRRYAANSFMENDHHRNNIKDSIRQRACISFSCCFSRPETASFKQSCYPNSHSPSSVMSSSFFNNRVSSSTMSFKSWQQEEIESKRSLVIDIDSNADEKRREETDVDYQVNARAKGNFCKHKLNGKCHR